jgi:hypothetical protein
VSDRSVRYPAVGLSFDGYHLPEKDSIAMLGSLKRELYRQRITGCIYVVFQYCVNPSMLSGSSPPDSC